MPSTASDPNAWKDSKSIASFGPSKLYVFRVNLPVTPELERQWYDTLSTLEVERFSRLRNDQARHLTLAGRGVLRCLLGRFLGVSAKDVPLRAGPDGKPEAEGIAFNVTHSGDIALIALAPSGSLGIDVERVDPAIPILEIASRYFAPTEIAAIRCAATEDLQRSMFFKNWTRKEAIIKADGRGLGVPLSSFAADDETSLPDANGSRRIFRVHSLPIGPGYAAAIASDDLIATPELFLYTAE